MISIIVPVFNVENYLSTCLSSILKQTFSDFEVILVDDGSTDCSGEICDDWVLKDKRIKVIHKQNGGLSSARNVGLDIAKGDFISFIDSDDYIAPDLLAKLKSAFEAKPDVDISVCVMDCVTEKSSAKYQKRFLRYRHSGVIPSFNFLTLIFKHKVDNAVCNKLYKRSVIGDIRFEEGKINEDILFNIAVLMQAKNIFYLSESLYYYRIRIGSITQQANPKLFDFISNAFHIKKTLLHVYDTKIKSAIDGYIFYEMTNYIATLLKYNSAELYANNILYCKKYLWKSFPKLFFNTSWGLVMKAKCILVSVFPSFYCFLLRLKK